MVAYQAMNVLLRTLLIITSFKRYLMEKIEINPLLHPLMKPFKRYLMEKI